MRSPENTLLHHLRFLVRLFVCALQNICPSVSLTRFVCVCVSDLNPVTLTHKHTHHLPSQIQSNITPIESSLIITQSVTMKLTTWNCNPFYFMSTIYIFSKTRYSTTKKTEGGIWFYLIGFDKFGWDFNGKVFDLLCYIVFSMSIMFDVSMFRLKIKVVSQKKQVTAS